MELKQFKISVLPLRNKLLNYARKLTESPDDAEDAVQEVLLKLWNKRLELEQYRSIEAFAMTMTHNLCMDMWRTKHTTNVPLEYVQDATPSGTPERLLEIKDEIRLMHEIINSLPDLQRTIMRMKDIEEYETEEIADITGCNPEAIRSNLSRARKKVREIYMQTIQEKIRRKGQTSCDEERELRRFFTQENIPESLQVYRPLFACLDQEAKAFQKESIPAKKLSFRRRFIYMTGGIAAGLLLLIGIAGTQRYLHATPDNYVIIDGKQYTDENLVREQALAAFRDMRTTEDEVLDLMFE